MITLGDDSKTWRTRATLVLKDGYPGLRRAANILKKGGLVAFPTETVYGLGAVWDNPSAIKALYRAKGRPADNPLIVHLAHPLELPLVTRDVPSSAITLIERFWPGPLTLVLPRSPAVPALVCAGLPTVAIRMPAHQTALHLIRAVGRPVVAPSANLSGRPSPTRAWHVLEDLSGKIDAVIHSAACPVGLESTVLDLTGSSPVLLRPGAVTREELSSALGIEIKNAKLSKIPGHPPPAPGMKYRHYSPRAALLLVTGLPGRRLRLMTALARYYQRRGVSVALLKCPPQNVPQSGWYRNYAADLYGSMRRLDRAGTEVIIVEEIGSEGLGEAIMNRLGKAATRVIMA